MKIFEKAVAVIRSYVGHLGVYFTLTVLILGALGGENRIFSPNHFGIAVLFAALLALCDFILTLKFIPSLLAKSALHAVFATLSFVIAFVLASGIVANSTAFVVSTVFLLVDAVALTVRAVYLSILRRREQ